MLRTRFSESLKSAMKDKDARAVSTLRLILAAIKDRDIAARADGNMDGISDDAILNLLQTMIRQRRESVEMYKKGDRPDLVQEEEEEIAIIESFLPAQLDEAETAKAVADIIEETGASSIKDMGRTMGLLRERYAGRMDFARASALLKEKLS